MKEETKRLILRDYERVNISIVQILSGERKNGRVISPEYLSPTVLTGTDADLPLDAEKGSLKYFKRIREGLEAALIEGSIPADLQPPLASDYINELVRKQGK